MGRPAHRPDRLRGTRVRFRFTFESVDAIENKYLGVVIDDFIIGSSNSKGVDTDGDGQLDACETDDDGDTIADSQDNCPLTKNPGQLDTDKDGVGDLCDLDDDGDGVKDGQDNCPTVPNPDQKDSNNNNKGDACEGTANSLPWSDNFNGYTNSFTEGGWSTKVEPGFGATAVWALTGNNNKRAQLQESGGFPSLPAVAAWLISPVIQTGSATAAKLTFSINYSNQQGGQFPSGTTLSVRARAAGSATWCVIATAPITSGTKVLSYDLNGLLPSAKGVQVAWLITGSAFGQPRWRVDDVSIQ